MTADSDQDRWLNAFGDDEFTDLVASNGGIMQDVPVHDISRDAKLNRSIFLSGASSRSSSKVPTSPRVQTTKGIALKRKVAFVLREDEEQEAAEEEEQEEGKKKTTTKMARKGGRGA